MDIFDEKRGERGEWATSIRGRETRRGGSERRERAAFGTASGRRLVNRLKALGRRLGLAGEARRAGASPARHGGLAVSGELVKRSRQAGVVGASCEAVCLVSVGGATSVSLVALLRPRRGVNGRPYGGDQRTAATSVSRPGDWPCDWPGQSAPDE